MLLVGAGRVGTAVAYLLERSGREPAGVVSRSPASAERAATRLGCGVISSLDDAPEADLYLLGVPDAAIEDVARSLAAVAAPGAMAVHFAGSLGIGPLEALAERGLGVAALHPVQACPDVGTAIERLPGSAWGITCSPGLTGRCEDFVRAVAGLPVPVEEADRALWHAAAVMTSNGIAALLATGESILQTIGVADPERVLGPLAAGAVATARAGGGGGATLTGPVVRGEVSTLRRHLEALDAQAPELVPAYRLVARTILAAAARAGRLPAEATGQIEAVVAG